MKDGYSNKSMQYERLFFWAASVAGIIGVTALLVPIYGLDVLKQVFLHGWFVILVALGVGIVSGMLQRRFMEYWFLRGLAGIFNWVVAILLSMAVVKYFQLPNAALIGWFMVIQYVAHYSVQPER